MNFVLTFRLFSNGEVVTHWDSGVCYKSCDYQLIPGSLFRGTEAWD